MRQRRTVDIEALNLANISPHTAAQVEHALGLIRDAFQDESPMLDGTERVAELTLKVKFTHNLERRETTVEADVRHKLPGYRRVQSRALLPHGAARFMVELDDEQPLFTFGDEAEGVQ